MITAEEEEEEEEPMITETEKYKRWN